MFGAADEAYAVANAAPEVLATATGVIGANAEDGVLRHLNAARAAAVPKKPAVEAITNGPSGPRS